MSEQLSQSACARCATALTDGDCLACRQGFTRSVTERLAANPAAAKLPSPHLQLYLMRDFLSAEECAGLMTLIDRNRQRSTTLGKERISDFRTSDSCNLDRKDPLVAAVEAKFADLMGISPEFGETIQGQRYAPGQYFKPHHDFFHTSQAYWLDQIDQGGQRTWTAMINLNEPDDGGATTFPTAGVRIKPRRGNVLIWNNLDEAGLPNHATLHEGSPVLAGTKYVITKWYRERPWGRPAAARKPVASK